MSPKSLLQQGAERASLQKATERDPAEIASPAASPDADAAAVLPGAQAEPSARPPSRQAGRGPGAGGSSVPAGGVGLSAEEIVATTPPPAAEPEMYPVRLDRREPLIPLNVKVPWSLKNGCELLAARDGTTMQDEVAEALRKHFAAKGLTPPSFWQSI